MVLKSPEHCQEFRRQWIDALPVAVANAKTAKEGDEDLKDFLDMFHLFFKESYWQFQGLVMQKWPQVNEDSAKKLFAALIAPLAANFGLQLDAIRDVLGLSFSRKRKRESLIEEEMSIQSLFT